MKTGTALIISSILLSIVLIFCTYQITSKMYAPPSFPSSLYVTTHEEGAFVDNSKDISSDFISLYEAAAYLRMDEAKLKSLIWSGKLDGTFTSYKKEGAELGYIFSSEKLAEVMKGMIEKGETLD
jgi:hypothetical protein